MAASLPLAAVVTLRPPEPGPVLLRVRYETTSSFWLYDPARSLTLPFLNERRVYSPSWSPDGRWLTYLHIGAPDTGMANYALYDTERHQIRTVASTQVLVPALWSPDSRRFLVYNLFNELRYVSTTDAGIRPARYIDSGQLDAVWSPDGNRLYYRQSPEDTLVVVETACFTDPLTCTPEPVPAEYDVIQLLGWMPNGEELMVLAAADLFGVPQVFSLDPATGAMALVLDNPLPGTVPAWSPDGELLAASLALPMRPNASLVESIPGVYVIDVAADRRALLWAGIAGQLAWSPDGRWLTFELIARAGNQRSVWLFERGAEGPINLTRPSESEGSPTWTTYRGRPFEVGWLLAYDGLLLALAWLLGRRRNAEPTSTEATRDRSVTAGP